MIKKLQRKFVAIAMLSIIIVTVTIFSIIAIGSYTETRRQTDELINMIIDNNGLMPQYKRRTDNEFITKETEFSTRYFTVILDDFDNVKQANMDNIAAVTKDDVDTILSNILKNDRKSTGYYENLKYKIVELDNGDRLIVFLDITFQINSLKSMARKTVIVLLSGYIVVFIAVYIFSKRALKPYIKNIEKQKQFITNAGHELKTPLAVIIADVDVLEMTTGEDNEWVTSIRNQANRLNTLIKSLLNLANVEEEKKKLIYTEFSLTEVIKESVNDFKALLQDRKVEFDNSNEISAQEDSIKQLITILLDNAIKYTENDGIISIQLSKHGRNTKLEISNTCQNIDKINFKKLFDRFYREDKSRNKKKDGYGIGLSIAKSIVDMHKGKISAYKKDDNMICFRVII